MPFEQTRLDQSVNQSRDIFDKYIYRTFDDTLAQVQALNYFEEARFADNWAGSLIEVVASDGYQVYEIGEDGVTLQRIGAGLGFNLGPIDNLFGATSGDARANPLTVQPASNRAAAEAVRDAYFAANPDNLAQYDAVGAETLGILLYFMDGADIETATQTRVAAQWRDSATIIALQGEPGADGMGVIDQSIPEGTILSAVDDNGTVVAGVSSLLDMPNRVRSSKQIDAPDAGAYILGNYDIRNAGNNIQIQELASNRLFFPVSYELETDGSTKAFREIIGPESVTASPTGDSELFTGDMIQFAGPNPNRGFANQYTVRRPANAGLVEDCNITIRINSHTDPTPIFDYKRATGGAGFDLPAGDGTNVINTPIVLPRPAFFRQD